jgi:cell division protein FtsQ
MPATEKASKKDTPKVWNAVIEQHVQTTAWSAAARRKLLVSLVNATGWFAIAAIAGLGVFAGITHVLRADEQAVANASAQPVRHLSVTTDGTLTEAWVRERIGIREGTPLLSIDLDVARAQLESEPQVRSATVRRQFPDTLAIFLMERSPIARIRTTAPDGGTVDLLVDRTGQLYEGVNPSPETLARLPFLAGVRLRRLPERGYAPLEGIQELALVLEQVDRQAPHLARTWRILDIGSMPRLTIRSDDVREIILDTSDLTRQLARLDYVLDFYRARSGSQIDRIDLSVGHQVAVRLGEESPLRALAQAEGNRLFRSR